MYEMGKQFRNESIDMTHNPEFTSCEFYQVCHCSYICKGGRSFSAERWRRLLASCLSMTNMPSPLSCTGV